MLPSQRDTGTEREKYWRGIFCEVPEASRVCVDDCFVPTTTRPCDDEDKMCCLTERENEKGDKDVALKVKLTKSVVSGVFQSKSLDIY